eukprot:9093256-Pyramimonas_sp.AAC.1
MPIPKVDTLESLAECTTQSNAFSSSIGTYSGLNSHLSSHLTSYALHPSLRRLYLGRISRNMCVSVCTFNGEANIS